MILEPADTELTWAMVEADAREMPRMAEAEWKGCGILMPDDAAQDIMLDHLDVLLAATAAALNITPANIYGARQRIRWLQVCDTPGDYSIWAAIDGGAPARLNQISTIQQ